jgi:hypothetical protein
VAAKKTNSSMVVKKIIKRSFRYRRVVCLPKNANQHTKFPWYHCSPSNKKQNAQKQKAHSLPPWRVQVQCKQKRVSLFSDHFDAVFV